jgi:hypothetical protein
MLVEVDFYAVVDFDNQCISINNTGLLESTEAYNVGVLPDRKRVYG